MKREPTFLGVQEVLAVHQRMIKEFGGDPSLRDHGLLESAVSMPMAKFSGSYLHPKLPDMAAAYLFHVCKNHPFVDGNKRTALATAEVFLVLNDMKLDATNKELEELTLGVADGSVSKKAATAFFRKKARRARTR